MKEHHDIPCHRTAGLISGAVAMFLLLAFAPHLRAQSADIFVPKPDGSAAEGSESAGNEVKPEPVDDKPSRFAGKDSATYTASRAAVFSMRTRATDPFGLIQDPNVKPVVRKIATRLPAERQAALPPTPLSDIVKLIRVTTIMPGEKQFLVGVRSFSQSEEFPLVYRGKKMRMKILEVSAQKILFQNLDNGEKAALMTEMLPAGMIAGGDRIQPPGLVSPLDNIPLELGSGRDLDANN
jgi:hypothetical protein